MILFRGYANDLPLDTWLKEKIWPLEEKLTEDDVYWGTKLAILEMIKTGTEPNNSLDMIREMKFTSLLQKVKEKDPTITLAKEIFEIATKNGAKTLKINVGEIHPHTTTLFGVGVKEEKFADLIYSASRDCVSDLICNGKILMKKKND